METIQMNILYAYLYENRKDANESYKDLHFMAFNKGIISQ